MRLQDELRPGYQGSENPFASYLAPGITWEEVAEMHQRPVDNMQRIVQRYVTGSDHYKWLMGKVGWGKLLMDEFGQVFRIEEYFRQAANDPIGRSTVTPFFDYDGGDTQFSTPIWGTQFDQLEGAIETIGKDLVHAVGKEGLLDRRSLGLYLHCSDNMAKNVIDNLQRGMGKDRLQYIVPKPLSQYAIKPILFEWPFMSNMPNAYDFWR